MKQPDCGHRCCSLRSNPYHTHSESPEACAYCQLEARAEAELAQQQAEGSPTTP